MSFSTSAGREKPVGRMFAVGGAAIVTLVSVAGAWGLGPGAPSAPPSPGQSVASPEVDADASDSVDAETPTDAAADPYAGDDGWLEIEDDTASAPPESDDPAKAAGDADAEVALPADSGSGRRIVYDVSAQRVWLVAAHNDVERTYPVSGARDESKLPPDTYEVYSKSRDAISYNHKETMRYMVRFSAGDNAAIGFHDVPEHRDGTPAQSRAELGTPLSAGCIRQWITDARALWKFAPVGTDVVVVA